MINDISRIEQNSPLQGLASILDDFKNVKELPPLLKNDNVKFIDLDKVLNTLKMNANEAQTNIGKLKIGNAFSRVISVVLQACNTADENIKHLNNAKQYSDEIDKLESENKSLNKEIKTLEQSCDSLKNQILAEKDPARKAELELALAKETAILSEKKTVVASNKSKIEEKNKKIKDALNAIGDPNVLLALAASMKINAADIINYSNDILEDKRSEEELEYLEKNNPLSIIRESILKSMDKFFDEILENKNDLV